MAVRLFLLTSRFEVLKRVRRHVSTFWVPTSASRISLAARLAARAGRVGFELDLYAGDLFYNLIYANGSLFRHHTSEEGLTLPGA